MTRRNGDDVPGADSIERWVREAVWHFRRRADLTKHLEHGRADFDDDHEPSEDDWGRDIDPGLDQDADSQPTEIQDWQRPTRADNAGLDEDDLAQVARLAAWDAVANYDPSRAGPGGCEGHVKARIKYALQNARRTARRQCGGRVVEERLVDPDADVPEDAPPVEQPEPLRISRREARGGDARKQAVAVLGRLSPTTKRTLARLADRPGASKEDLAQEHQIPVSTWEKRLRAAKRDLDAALSEIDDVAPPVLALLKLLEDAE